MTRWLVLATLVVLGLFGSSIDRVVVATPTWEHLGALDWAAYSRHADLGNGLILYPIIGILPTVLAIAAAITHRSTAPGRAWQPHRSTSPRCP